ncbi:PREDICTED: RELT-like protein 2 [Gekko japonicus]|uniref:RELT-like protein 2 n=1 Tax=Gekko japonicus TaxID=146911 RepID=A0ABM1JYS8_GEKJA|nr:PREDICTED: RELT-like protein 2 [Gekko japonicus]
MSEQNSTQDGERKATHSLSMPYLMVLVFFAMGLLGFLICHILKKKGYRCRTFHDELDLEHKESLTPLDGKATRWAPDKMCLPTDQWAECLVAQRSPRPSPHPTALRSAPSGRLAISGPSQSLPRRADLCPHRNSQDGGPPHHHTVHLGSTQAPCMHCSKKKRHPLHRQSRSKEGKSKMHPGETTVFSVGRFHVTHIGKKPASHDSKEDSLPDSKQDLGSRDLDRETWKGSLNGIVPMDQLQHGSSQEAAGAQSDREPEEACKDESTQGKNLLNAAANLDVPKNGLERKNHPKTGSLQEIDLLGCSKGS